MRRNCRKDGGHRLSSYATWNLLAQLLVWTLTPGSSRGASSMVGLRIRATQTGVTNPVCVRAIIVKSDGTYVDGEWLDPGYPPITMRGKAMTPDTVVQVPTGVTRITIGKGPDYIPQTITTNLTSALSLYTLNVALQPALDFYSRGWRAAEMHLHYIHGDNEILRAPQDAWAICAAGGLNLVQFCEEHYGAGTLDRQHLLGLWAPYVNSECQLGLGLEEPKNAWGHQANILYDPWSIRSAMPYYWGIHNVHVQGGVSFPVHPERQFPPRYYDDPVAGRTWNLFPFNNYSKCYPMDALVGHVIDGWSGVSDEANNLQTLPPYFRLLAMGYKIPLLADSDFCMDRINNGYKATGCWMTYYYLGGQPLTRAAIADAMRQGRVMCTTGPLVLFNIDNAMSGDTLPADGRSHTVRIQASYTFNPWTFANTAFDGSTTCKITEIDLYRNGQLFQQWTPNTPTATVQTTITESSTNSYYMVRVLGNDTLWMAAYASPIYFDNGVRPRQPPGFKALIQGYLYDAVSGSSLTGAVSSVRYGHTDWTIPTDSQGRFQAYVPLDADLVATDSTGRTFTQNALKQEAVYSFGHYLPENYSTNEEASINAFSNIVRQMRWEFPMGYQLAASCVRTNLTTDATMSNFSVASAPAFTPGKQNSEIVMLLVDKTQVQIGDTINYAAIYRSPQQPPTDLLEIEWKGWNPQYPTIFNKYSQSVLVDNNPSALVSLGGGFYLRQGSVVVPSWVANVTDTTAALQMWVNTRTGGPVDEDAQVLIPIGPTQRQLLVSSTWDGLPASWTEIGIGPCNFRRDWTDFLVRYSDYRNLTVNLTLNGRAISLRPKVDTVHVANADDALFYEPFYYDGQCEPQWRNIAFRDTVRTQPSPPSFSTVPIQNPPDTSPPLVVAIQPANGDSVAQTNVWFSFLVDDLGLSGAASATLLIDGSAVTNTTASPVSLKLSPGNHTWQVRGLDNAGNSALSTVNSFHVGPPSPPSVSILTPTNNAVVFGPSVALTASASSSAGIAEVQYTLDGAELGLPQAFAPYSVTWDTTTSSFGPHRLAAIAQDLIGNSSTSAVVTVTVDNHTVVSNTVWVDDTLPAGATPGSDGGDAWTWVSSNPKPFSGSLASQSNIGPGEHQHFFYGATARLTVKTNDSLFAYVYLDPANVPDEVMLQWFDGSWEHRAFWGNDDITIWGMPGTTSRWYMGPLPATGQWVQLSVPASLVALEGSTLNGMAFTLYGGRGTWDYAGKSSQFLINPPPPIQLSGGFSNKLWQVRFANGGSNFLYTLQRSLDLKTWTNLSSITGVTSPLLMLQDTNPPTARSFYRLVVQ
jgi:hypothetical protein